MLPLHRPLHTSHQVHHHTYDNKRPLSNHKCPGAVDIMDQRRPPEFVLEVFASPESVKDVVRGKPDLGLSSSAAANAQRVGILHTIFFHRFFPSIRPKTRDVLDLTLPFVEDVELETLIDQRTATLVRQLDTNSDMGARNTGVRGLMAVQFFEKKRRKAWFMKAEEEVCWEQWTLDVTLATPRTESGTSLGAQSHFDGSTNVVRNRKSESKKGHGGYVTEGDNEDCDHRQ